jgi:hypothetical protein
VSIGNIIALYGEMTDMESGYYGTVTINGTTYRSKEKFKTEQDAKDWADTAANTYVE